MAEAGISAQVIAAESGEDDDSVSVAWGAVPVKPRRTQQAEAVFQNASTWLKCEEQGRGRRYARWD